jgi:hypothetical protein
MGKKCIPGLFCIGNMTLFFIFLLFLFMFYLFLRISDLGNKMNHPPQINPPPIQIMNPSQPLTNLYAPPVRNDNYSIPPIATRPFDQNYRQIGILTRNSNSASDILPLMGRRQLTSRDKWQYYTMTGNNIQMKLPVSVNGKSCTGEYGCNEIFNNDTVYVEGFKDIFIATIYENNTFNYIA